MLRALPPACLDIGLRLQDYRDYLEQWVGVLGLFLLQSQDDRSEFLLHQWIMDDQLFMHDSLAVVRAVLESESVWLYLVDQLKLGNCWPTSINPHLLTTL